MNAHVPSFGALKPSQLVEEYERKAAALEGALQTFEASGDALRMAATIGGTWGNVSINTGNVDLRQLKRSLLCSAWKHVYEVLQIDRLASAKDKRRFEQSIADPAPFTLDNIRATFGHYIADPRGSILRGLAEVFSDLDPAYKSHEKVKIGVAGLPKRIVIASVGGFGSLGKDKLESVINALAVYQGKPLVTWPELDALLKDGEALLATGEVADPHRRRDETHKTISVIGRGIRLKRFQNGNGHLHFEPDTLADINRALAEFYGDVLPDAHDDEVPKKADSRAVSKDLQYYPTPVAVVKEVLNDLGDIKGLYILEPSCGCGRFLDAMRARGAKCLGIEVDPGRAEIARSKGHSVMTKNFLETVPTGNFDRVVMNPPFYGRHYAKHVAHALGFLKPGGILTAILPATARYDHGIITDEWAAKHRAKLSAWTAWKDLPIGAFAESGTNINTCVVQIARMA